MRSTAEANKSVPSKQAEKWHKQSVKRAQEDDEIVVIAEEGEKKLRQECAEAGVTL